MVDPISITLAVVIAVGYAAVKGWHDSKIAFAIYDERDRRNKKWQSS